MQKPDVDLEKECRNCLHRKTGWVCKNQQSSRFEQKVSSEDSCRNFAASLAQAHYIRAFSNRVYMLNEKTLSGKERALHEVIDHYDAAIKEGLPKEDEVEARVGVAAAYAEVVAYRLNSTGDESVLNSEDAQRILSEMRVAGDLEKKSDIHEIATSWYQLSRVDTLIAYKASVIQRDRSTEESERFLRQQLGAVDHIHPTALPTTLSLLGKFLMRQGKTEAAADCFRNILNSLARKDAEYVGNASKLRQEVGTLLGQISGKRGPQTSSRAATREAGTKEGGTSQKTGCFIATAVYGSELAPQVVFLKRFRDEVLLPSRAGRFFVASYYRLSPLPARFIARHPRLSASIRLLIVVPALKLAKLVLKRQPAIGSWHSGK